MANLGNLFTDENAIKTIDLFRVLYLGVAVFAFFITKAGRELYRPFIYENGINDYWIADSIGNLGGIIVQIYFSFALLNTPKKKGFRVIGFLVIGYILYEILQPYLPHGVFDWKDIYGTVIGGFISIFIWLAISVLVKNKVIYKFWNKEFHHITMYLQGRFKLNGSSVMSSN